MPKSAISCILLSLSAILLFACTQETEITPEEHRDDVEKWRANRIERLTAPDGWLSLGGLYWFEDSVQRFGTADDVDFNFPAGSVPEYAGEFELRGDTVLMRVHNGIDIQVDGGPLQSPVIYTPDHAVELKYNRLTWIAIQRGELTGIRLFDTESPILANFKGIDSYPVDIGYRTIASLVPHEEFTPIPVTNILGQTDDVESAGKLKFELDGEKYSLIALGTGDRLFIIVADETSRTETFPGGRYMYVDNPGPGGTTVLDFNKAYNPPCAFSPYTTCQLPPEGNTLPVAIRAGEKLP